MALKFDLNVQGLFWVVWETGPITGGPNFGAGPSGWGIGSLKLL